MAGMWLVGEDLPQESNRVTLNHDVHDQFGVRSRTCTSTTTRTTRRCASTPTPRVNPSTGPSTRTRTFRVPPYPATHNLGTARMSARPQDGVVNDFGARPRRAEPVRGRWQRDDHRRRSEPDADDRGAGPPAGRLHRGTTEGRGAVAAVPTRRRPAPAISRPAARRARTSRPGRPSG